MHPSVTSIKRSHVHIYYVLTGKRVSRATEKLLLGLPKRPYMPYRRMSIAAH